MADLKQDHVPAPKSGYDDQQDPRGKPGEHQKETGRQIPEDKEKDGSAPPAPRGT